MHRQALAWRDTMIRVHHMPETNEPSPRPFPKFPEQDENGADLSLIRSNMRLTVTERVRRHDAWTRGLEELRKNMPESTRRIYERLKAQW
jgi:hypothetical protein